MPLAPAAAAAAPPSASTVSAPAAMTAGPPKLKPTSTSGKAWSRPPITMEFSCPRFAASGMIVRFLKVFEKTAYQTTKWVRYITRNGHYQIRI